MSKISTIHTALISIIGTTLFPEASGYFRLPNPYKLEKNPDIYLSQGWGLRIDEATNPRRQLSKSLTIDRVVRVPMTRKLYALAEDPVGRADAEKLLLEDHFLLVKQLETNATINESAINANYISDSGVQMVRDTEDTFLFLETVFTVQYFENLRA